MKYPGFGLLVLLVLLAMTGYAQAPSNDLFKDAQEIVVPSSGYGLGSFQSAQANLTNAGKQSGESFPKTFIDYGLNRKTVWYKFSIATGRSVTISLKQQDTMIAQNAVGFVVYTPKQGMPNQGEVSPHFTMIPKFGNASNTCVTAGTYYVQVCANFKANDKIWLTLDIANPAPALYDTKAGAYNFGTLSTGARSLDFATGCLSIESDLERCTSLGSDYKEYTQSAWFVFTTGKYPDIIDFTVYSNYLSGVDSVHKMAMNIYTGNATSSPGSLTPFDTGIIVKSNVSYKSLTLSLNKKYRCSNFSPNTTYSIQLFFHRNALDQSATMQFYSGVSDTTKSANPAAIPAAYKLGVLADGQSRSSPMQLLACNAKLQYNQCGTVVSGNTIIDSVENLYYPVDTFDLNCWVTFEVPGTGVVDFNTFMKTCTQWNYNNIGRFHMFRLYNGDVSQNCNLTLNKKWAGNMPVCLDKGKYSLQFLGRSNRTLYGSCDEYDIAHELTFRVDFNSYEAQRPAKFDMPSKAENLGDICKAPGKTKKGIVDYYGGVTDSSWIDSILQYNHATYRQFYLSEKTDIVIESMGTQGNSGQNQNVLYRGKATDGRTALTQLERIYGYSVFNIGYGFSSNACLPLDTGWYTVVTSQHIDCLSSILVYDNNIRVSIPTPCTPKYNKPYKAYKMNTLTWGPSGVKRYTPPIDCYTCVIDSVVKNSIPGCSAANGSYYVFTLLDEVRITVSGSTYFTLYNVDLSKDSMLISDTTHMVQKCYGEGEFCRLQPGVYTIVAYDNGYQPNPLSLWVDRVLYSNYDHAINSYDFGLIPDNQVTKTSPPDVFACTTGAHVSDPSSLNYWYSYYENSPYPVPKNSIGYFYNKNLWYTFTVSGTGTVNLSVAVLTAGYTTARLPFSVLRSDANGTLLWVDLKTANGVDSTLEQGLTELVYSGFPENNVASFQKSGCDTVRYYVVLGSANNNGEKIYGNYLTALSVKYQGISNTRAGDYCTNAVTVNANGPGAVSGSALVNCHTIGESYGEDGSNMGCLFGPAKYKSTWFKFKLTTTQKVDLSFSVTNNTSATFDQIRYRILYGSCNAMNPGPCVAHSLSSFRLDCMAAGDYYMQVITPEEATGIITANMTVTVSTYPICKPFSLFEPLANFTTTGDCNSKTIAFTNLSSAGSYIKYLWDFGNGTTSTLKVPSATYAPVNSIDTFKVKLIVEDSVNHVADSIMLPVYVFRDSIKLDAGTDQMVFLNTFKPVQLNAVTNYPYPIFNWMPEDNLSNPYAANPVSYSNQTTLYTITMTGDGCELKDPVSIYVLQRIYTHVVSMCPGQITNLTGPYGYDYDSITWSTGDTGRIITVSDSGLYTFNAYLQNGFIYHDTIRVKFRDISNMNLGPDLFLCNGSPVTLNAGAGFLDYLWSTGAITQRITAKDPGNYFVAVTNIYGCKASDTITLTEYVPQLTLTDTSMCTGTSVLLDAGAGYNAYSWSTGEHTQQITATQGGAYVVTVLSNNCPIEDTILVTEYASEIDLVSDTFFCNTETLVLTAGEGFDSYQWSTGAVSQSTTVSSPNTYTVIASNLRCIDTGAVHVTQFTSVPVFTRKDTTFCEAFSLELDAGTGDQYLWYPSGDNTKEIYATSFGTYSVTKLDSNGCRTTDNFTISRYCEGGLYVPNVFTINGDGLNDIFYAVSRNIDAYEMLIVNRWGEIVFTSTDLKKGWDGTFKGELAQSDVYCWIVWYTDTNGRHFTQKGTVTLLR